ncbi:MAG: MFS transporter [Chloroflexi bacterium]|nr:MFS transporter [Chloroflexota bacterium]
MIAQRPASGGPKPRFFYGWIILASTFTTLFMATGMQYSFGVFFKPILNEFGWDRASLSLAASINAMVYGSLQPLIGKIIDERGPRPVMITCGIVMSAGIAAISLTSDLWVIYVAYGVVAASGVAGLTVVSTSALVVRWFVKRRGMALSVAGAGFAAGQLFIIPVAAYVIMLFGWRNAAVILGGFLGIVVLPLAIWVMKSDPEKMGWLPDGERLDSSAGSSAARGKSITAYSSAHGVATRAGARTPAGNADNAPPVPIRRLVRTRTFWLLCGGFYVCGFTASLVLTHLPASVTDRGMSEMVAANAIGIIGLAATVSALAVGTLSDFTGRKNPLAGIYGLRGLALLLLISVVSDVPSLYLFALLFGMSRAATIPLTSGLIGDIYGRRSIGITYGLILFAHQVGAAMGSYMAGAFYDATGSYFWAFFTASMLGFFAAVCSYLIKEERKVREPSLAPSR